MIVTDFGARILSRAIEKWKEASLRNIALHG
jgi:hypothetical protein